MSAWSGVRRTWPSRGALLLSLIAMFVTVAGSRLWLISLYGNDVPFWDQWNGEADRLYKPLLDHGPAAVDWFAAHNEHRMAVSRVGATVLLYLNGQWDPIVQMCWGAFCAALVCVALCAMVARVLPAPSALLVWMLALIGTAMPYGWENSLAGFQTQFDYLLLAALVMFHLVGDDGVPSTRRCVALCVLGVFSLFTMASGALTCFATFIALTARIAFDRDRVGRRMIGLALVMLVLAAIGVAMTPQLEAHAVLRAHGVTEWWRAFDLVAGWPTLFGPIVWIPMALWIVRALWTRRLEPGHSVLVALAAFVLLNDAAIALSRGANAIEAGVSSRYTDLVWLAWLVNLWAAVSLAASPTRSTASRVLRDLSLVACFTVAAAALAMAGWSALPGAVDRALIYATESGNTHNYVARRDPAWLTNKLPLQLPYPDADFLKRQLDDPTLRSILPPGIRPGIVQRSVPNLDDLARSGVVLTGVPSGSPPAPPPMDGYFYGTFGPAGDAHIAHFTGPWIDAQGRYVRLQVSGYLGLPGLSLYLEDEATGRRASLAPPAVVGRTWFTVQTRLPGKRYRLVAEDASGRVDGWFAFTDPVEVGRLRPFAEWLMGYGKATTVFGFFALLGLLVFFRRQLVPGPDGSRA